MYQTFYQAQDIHIDYFCIQRVIIENKHLTHTLFLSTRMAVQNTVRF